MPQVMENIIKKLKRKKAEDDEGWTNEGNGNRIIHMYNTITQQNTVDTHT